MALRNKTNGQTSNKADFLVVAACFSINFFGFFCINVMFNVRLHRVHFIII